METVIMPSFPWKNSLTGKEVKKIYMNRDIKLPLLNALFDIQKKGLKNELKTFDGCFCIRSKRGLTELSMHSWGLAIDINASTNKLGTIGDMNKDIVEIFKKYGFSWGGDWKRKDPMHFELT
jgi:hypothetical protein